MKLNLTGSSFTLVLHLEGEEKVTTRKHWFDSRHGDEAVTVEEVHYSMSVSPLDDVDQLVRFYGGGYQVKLAAVANPARRELAYIDRRDFTPEVLTKIEDALVAHALQVQATLS